MSGSTLLTLLTAFVLLALALAGAFVLAGVGLLAWAVARWLRRRRAARRAARLA